MKTDPNAPANTVTKRESFVRAALLGFCSNSSTTSYLSQRALAHTIVSLVDHTIGFLNMPLPEGMNPDEAPPETVKSPVAEEAAANDKAIEEMNEDKVEELAGVLLLACRGLESEEVKNALVLRQVFGSPDHPETRKNWLSVARAAIEYLKKSKWESVAFDLDVRHLYQQSVVDAFEKQAHAARTAEQADDMIEALNRTAAPESPVAEEAAANDKAIEEMKSESKWRAVALDLCSHLRKTLPTLDDAREDARHLNRQSVVDAFDRQTDAARAAIAQAERAAEAEAWSAARAERSEGGAE